MTAVPHEAITAAVKAIHNRSDGTDPCPNPEVHRSGWRQDQDDARRALEAAAPVIVSAAAPVIAAAERAAEAEIWARKCADVAEKAHAAERERIAQLAEQWVARTPHPDWADALAAFAALLREQADPHPEGTR